MIVHIVEYPVIAGVFAQSDFTVGVLRSVKRQGKGEGRGDVFLSVVVRVRLGPRLNFLGAAIFFFLLTNTENCV